MFGTEAAGFRALHAARMVEAAAAKVCGGDARRGGAFLTSIAAGEDAAWPVEDAARAWAAKIRSELTGWLGSARHAVALLRMMTRDGRLFPGPQRDPNRAVSHECSCSHVTSVGTGLAPPVEGVVVSGDHGEVTPEEEVWRMRAAAGAALGLGGELLVT